jgi:hypothetical protein
VSGSGRRLTLQILQRLTVDAQPWLSCDDCFHLLDQYVELLLRDPTAELPAMRAHLVGCAACADEATSLLLLAAQDAGVDPRPALQRLPASN